MLIAPLDWGLGHSTRCIPIIKHLLSLNCEVVIAAERLQFSLLQKEFPRLRMIKLHGYRLTFGISRWKTLVKFFLQIPKILMSIKREKDWLDDLLLENKFDMVVSDNRYGLFNSKVVSIFITHQLTIKTPFGKGFDGMLRKINYRYINKFTECWVPDYAGVNNMGGELSHPPELPGLPLKYLGPLSRIKEGIRFNKNIELLIILSGPEPQRSIFEKILVSQLRTFHKIAVLVRGLPGESNILTTGYDHLQIYNHLEATALNEIINDAGVIISRSGYSTVMDLLRLQKKCIFVPTPGQTEQEYLANYLASKNLCLNVSQSAFSLESAVEAALNHRFEYFEPVKESSYQQIITDFIIKLETRGSTEI